MALLPAKRRTCQVTLFVHRHRHPIQCGAPTSVGVYGGTPATVVYAILAADHSVDGLVMLKKVTAVYTHIFFHNMTQIPQSMSFSGIFRDDRYLQSEGRENNRELAAVYGHGQGVTNPRPRRYRF